MPKKNKKGGKKYKRRGKRGDEASKRELIFKTEDHEYAKVTKMLGSSRVMCIDTDFVVRNCLIRGKMRKRVWINPGDIVLIEKDEYNKKVGLVVHKYYPNEIRRLEKLKEITSFEPETNKDKEKDEITDLPIFRERQQNIQQSKSEDSNEETDKNDNDKDDIVKSKKQKQEKDVKSKKQKQEKDEIPEQQQYQQKDENFQDQIIFKKKTKKNVPDFVDDL